MRCDVQSKIFRERKQALTNVAFSHPVKLNTISKKAVAELELSGLEG